MKKTSFFIMMIFILTMLTACTQNKEPAKGPEKAALNKSNIEPNSLQIPTNVEIVFFNNQKLYYNTDKFNPETPEQGNKTLNEYDFNSKTIKPLSTVTNITTSPESFAVNNGDLYLSFSRNNVETILIKADMKKGSNEIIKKWETSIPQFANVYALDNNLILSGIKGIGETTECYVNKINLSNNKQENIIEKKMKNKKGELIACIDVDDKYIYAFLSKADKTSENYKISQYDFNGKLLKTYPIDLKFYLGSSTLKSQDDYIADMYKEKDYFIINTGNGRVFIFKVKNNKLQPVKLPENFYKDTSSGFRFIEYYDGVSDFAYFQNTFYGNNNIITVFDYTTGKLIEIEFSKIKNARSSNDYYRNASGDLIIKKPKGESINEFEYFFYKSPYEKIIL